MREEEFPGRFIVFEGPDGSGTTTQSRRTAEELDAYWTAEPTSGEIGRKVDKMISEGESSAESIALAFAADRMVHLEEEILPRLRDGETVVCDRYYHSSLVYQPLLGAERDWVRELNSEAIKPDITVFLNVRARTGMRRVRDRGEDGNIFEDLDFQEKVAVSYRELGERLEEDIEMVDASGTVEEVFEECLRILGDR
ncbi:MAG: dTMP kinase [Candidatus Nanohaloarchaea archaeon]